jgi:hypothetical protein
MPQVPRHSKSLPTVRKTYNDYQAREQGIDAKPPDMWPKRYNCGKVSGSAERKTMAWHGHGRKAAIVAIFCVIASSALAQGDRSGAWRLLRTSNADGWPTTAMTHTADMIRSDVDLAGLMLLCEDSRRPAPAASDVAQVIIVVVTPFAPHANPNVTISTADHQWQFEGSIVPPGAELLLPPAAAALVHGPWLTTHELTVKISWQNRSFGGVIQIDGLAGALATLAANCPSH